MSIKPSFLKQILGAGADVKEISGLRECYSYSALFNLVENQTEDQHVNVNLSIIALVKINS